VDYIPPFCIANPILALVLFLNLLVRMATAFCGSIDLPKVRASFGQPQKQCWMVVDIRLEDFADTKLLIPMASIFGGVPNCG
jgi:hypothetical protein